MGKQSTVRWECSYGVHIHPIEKLDPEALKEESNLLLFYYLPVPNIKWIIERFCIINFKTIIQLGPVLPFPREMDRGFIYLKAFIPIRGVCFLETRKKCTPIETVQNGEWFSQSLANRWMATQSLRYWRWLSLFYKWSFQEARVLAPETCESKPTQSFYLPQASPSHFWG